MNKLHLVECPLCGGEQLHKFLVCKDHYATGENFAILECDNCGFRMTQDAPVEAEIGRYYESPDYISHSNTHKGLMNRVYHYVRAYMLRKKAKLVENASGKKSGRILDIGTGTGYFSQTMKTRGWQVDAIEKSAQARDFAKQNFGLEIKDESEVGHYGNQVFDVITMWHVLEHVENQAYEWEILHRQLKDDGVLVIAVPNCSSTDAKRYGAFWAAYDVPRHLWHFTPETMQRMAEKQGFSLQEKKPMPFDGFYVSMLSEKYKGCSLYFLKGAWTGLKAWFSTWMNAERSSSMIYIFRKK